MKSKILVTVILGILTIAFQNCEKSPFIAYEGKIDSLVKSNTAENKKIDTHLDSLHYFRGGWFGPADMPNWGNDVTIEEKEGVYNISAKTTDSFCGKVSAQLTEDQVKELQILLAELDNHKVPEDAILVADGGVRQITVKNLNQDAVTIQLNQMFESQDGLYAANGDSLAACIEALDQSLMMYCQ